MIEVNITSAARPRVLAVFSYRYDAELVPSLLANIAPFVDGWIALDDRASVNVFTPEVPRRLSLLEAACEAGADWALAVDPDERFERGLQAQMPALLAHPQATAHTFALRELYGPLHYRVDGVWGIKRQPRLIHLRAGLRRPDGDLHLPWSAFIPDPRLNDTAINLYHLKMITPARRRARAALYSALDPSSAVQAIGYDYLANEQGAALEAVPPGREYLPPHIEDGGLWIAPVSGA
jgi:hypothetical protein